MTKTLPTDGKAEEKSGKKRNRYDSPWKRLISRHFRGFMDFFFPHISQQINWNEKYRFMDKEMQSIQDPVDDNETGDRNADKLVEVIMNSGKPANVMIHIEVQDGEQTDFAERMFVYHYRIFDRYRRRIKQSKSAQNKNSEHSFCEHIISLALLSDINRNWKPSTYQHELLGCEMNFKFPVAKLTDFKKELNPQELENPFAVATNAHTTYKEARKQINNAEKTGKPKQEIYQELFRQKRNLFTALYKAGFKRTVIRDLFEFVGLIMKLPQKMEKELEIEILEIEKKEAPEVSYFKRFLDRGKEEGEKLNFYQTIKKVLKKRFQEQADAIMVLVEKIEDCDTLDEIFDMALEKSPEEIRETCLKACSSSS